MLFPISDMMVPTGPPPQAILNQRWLWQILLALLSLSFVMRFIGLDIPGALLSGLMLCFAVIMTRDGMQEIARYALVFAVLCGLNFFFDILPLLTELGGRVQSKTLPMATTTGDGVRQTEYRVTVKTTPFFDPTEGLVYNVQSFGMILSPIAMALGVFLSLSAHNEFQRNMNAFGILDEDFGEAGLGARRAGPARNTPRGDHPDAQEDRPVGEGSSRRLAPAALQHFQGQGRKLDEAP